MRRGSRLTYAWWCWTQERCLCHNTYMCYIVICIVSEVILWHQSRLHDRQEAYDIVHRKAVSLASNSRLCAGGLDRVAACLDCTSVLSRTTHPFQSTHCLNEPANQNHVLLASSSSSEPGSLETPHHMAWCRSASQRSHSKPT